MSNHPESEKHYVFKEKGSNRASRDGFDYASRSRVCRSASFSASCSRSESHEPRFRVRYKARQVGEGTVHAVHLGGGFISAFAQQGARANARIWSVFASIGDLQPCSGRGSSLTFGKASSRDEFSTSMSAKGKAAPRLAMHCSRSAAMVHAHHEEGAVKSDGVVRQSSN